jgi:hypothetical protein
LPRLLGQIAPPGRAAGARVSPALFNQKLGSLARLALTAAVQKREFLRRLVPDRPALNRGFLLDRARLVVVPVGLDSTVRSLAESALCTGSGTEMACQILRELSSVLQRDGQAYRLETCLDSAADIAFDAEDAAEQTHAPTSPGQLPTLAQVAGLTPWDTGASPRGQVRAAGLLHASVGAGTAAILVPLDQILTAGSVVDLLRFTWQQTDVTRLRLLFARHQPAADLPFAEA